MILLLLSSSVSKTSVIKISINLGVPPMTTLFTGFTSQRESARSLSLKWSSPHKKDEPRLALKEEEEEGSRVRQGPGAVCVSVWNRSNRSSILSSNTFIFPPFFLIHILKTKKKRWKKNNKGQEISRTFFSPPQFTRRLLRRLFMSLLNLKFTVNQ